MRCVTFLPGSNSTFHISNLTIANPMLEPHSNHLSFNTHLSKSSFSIKTRSGSFQTHVATESLYELLGISESGTVVEIKRAYKRLVLKYHPDVSPPECIEEYMKKFIQIQEAYETLSDPRSRALYDRDMARGLHIAFSAKKRLHHNEGSSNDRSEWRNQWQFQLNQLKKKKSIITEDNMSWGARIRRQNVGV